MRKPRNLSPWVKIIAIVVLLAAIAVPAAVYLWSGPQHPVEGAVCELKPDDEYRSVMNERLAPYQHDTLLAEFDDPAAVDAAGYAEDIGNRSYIPMFAIQSCMYADQLRAVNGALNAVVNELPNRNSTGHRAAPADLEAGWFEDLGVDGLLTGWAMVALIGNGQAFWDTGLSADMAAERAEEIQSLFSHGLANATNPDREALIAENNYTPFSLNPDFYLGEDYLERFIEFGDRETTLAKYEGISWIESPATPGSDIYRPDADAWKPEAVGPTIYGWTALAPLLRFGHFHEDFLTPVATAIIEFDQKHDGDWAGNGAEYHSLDLFGNGEPDAIDAVLEACARNQAAAAAVYAATGDERLMPFLGDD